MSTTVDQAFIKQYESEVHLDYQRVGSIIRGTVRTKSGIVGATTKFQKIGTGTASTKTRHGNITVMNLDHTGVEATLVDYYTGEYVDALDELKTNIDERSAITKSAAMAMGRKTDELLIAAIDDATNSTPITLSTEGAIRNSFLEAVQNLRDRDVPFDGEVWGLISPRAEAALMTTKQFANADYTGATLPFVNPAMGKVRSWLGVHWLVHSGLPLSTNTRTGFIYHKSAVGHAIGSEVVSDVAWIAEKASHFFSNRMSQGAVLIDNNGVEELTIDESTALPVS